MKLPDFGRFDGAVIVRNTIQHEPTARQVLAALRESNVVRLNRMWVYDMLTHLYNRSGFFHYAVPTLAQLKENKKRHFCFSWILTG